jgi:hypothetical protein
MNPNSRLGRIATAALIILSVALAQVPAASAKPPGSDGNASFPEVSDSWSPDGRFVVKNVDHPNDPNSPHSIMLTDMQTGRRSMLYSYGWKVDLFWSPASDALAINDWDANDDAQCIVLVLAPRRERIDLREEFLKSRRPDREKKLAADRHAYDHNYAHLIRWLNANTLLSAFEGHSSDRKRGFQLIYEYKLGESFRLRKRTVS